MGVRLSEKSISEVIYFMDSDYAAQTIGLREEIRAVEGWGVVGVANKGLAEGSFFCIIS